MVDDLFLFAFSSVEHSTQDLGSQINNESAYNFSLKF